MHLMFKALRIRFTITCTALTGLILVCMALGSLRITERQLVERASEDFSASLNSIFFYLRGQAAIDHTWLSQTESNGGLIIYMEDGGRPLQYAENKPERAALVKKAQALALEDYGFDSSAPPSTRIQPDKVVFQIEESGTTYRAAVCAVPVTKGWLGIVVMKSTAPEQAQIFTLRLSFGGLILAAILFLFLFAWFFTARMIRPVEESRLKQAEFVSAASHELRSPLSVIRASADAMENAPPEQAERFLHAIQEESVRMTRLTDDLLTLAGSDSHHWSVQKSPEEPETLVLSVSERFEPLAHEKKITLRVNLPSDPLPRCKCDGMRVEQLLSILADNALCYTPEGGQVTLEANCAKKGLLLTVSDTGPGIPDEQKPLIFDRFYRADPSRSKREHYGLGLSIAKEIALLHHGSLTVSDGPSGGTVFTLLLPLGTNERERNSQQI